MGLFNIKHNVQLTYIFKVFIKSLYKIMNEFQKTQLIDFVIIVNTYNEIQRCISPVDYFVLPVLQKAALVLGATQAFPNKFSFKSNSFSDAEIVEVFG